jgi:adenosylhomocysteine nucleosidase
MTRVAIIAAMAGELKPLVRGWRRESRGDAVLWRHRGGESEWIAACAGIGVNAANRAFAEIEKEGTIDCVYSVGWAGSLRMKFATGRAYRVSGVTDAKSGERFPAATRSGECWLVTCDRVADRAAKRNLAEATGADLVDMEAAGIARLAAMHGIPFCCIKGVSDGVDDQLPDFNGFISRSGHFSLVRYALFATLRPWDWPALLRMGKESRKAAESIAESLLEILEAR